jgi:hypothetical protein
MKIKDYFLSQETFEVKPSKHKGILQKKIYLNITIRPNIFRIKLKPNHLKIKFTKRSNLL